MSIKLDNSYQTGNGSIQRDGRLYRGDFFLSFGYYRKIRIFKMGRKLKVLPNGNNMAMGTDQRNVETHVLCILRI